MENSNSSFIHEERITEDAHRLSTVLKEMQDGLDIVRNKVQVLTQKVKENQFPTADGISYLEAKNLLLLNYCNSLVYYVFRKAKGFSIEGHPVVRSLVEIRLFLEKIRSIDKKLQYQIQKLTRVSGSAEQKVDPNEKDTNVTQNTEDLLLYRPNPDMLVAKEDIAYVHGDGVYRPPKFAPSTMVDEKASKQKLRKERETLRQARQSAYVREMMDDLEGRPQQINERDTIGAESRELTKYLQSSERRAQREEELFTRTPLTKMEKKKAKHLEKSRNGLGGLTDSFYDEIKTLPMEIEDEDQMAGFGKNSVKGGKFKRRKRKY